MFVAVDPNNPHVLYKSKTGRPEAFPIINYTTNVANAINVGTPSNYINAITEYSGGVLCLNINNLFYVRVASGVMETPLTTPAQRGLIAKKAWCRADNEIWYVSYDGVYSWSGGESTWRSEAIDPLFKGLSIGPYKPVDLRPNLGSGGAGADLITMEYANNEVFLSYQDTSQNPYRLRYHTKYNRWAIETHTDPLSSGNACDVTAQLADRTSGKFYIAKHYNSAGWLYQDGVGSSDGWGTVATDGAAIPFAFIPAAMTVGAPNVNKTFSDISLELNTGATVSTDLFFDFADTTSHATAGDAFTIAPTAKRTRYPMAINSGYGREAYAMQGRIYGSSTVANTFHSVTANFIPLTQIQTGRSYDWDDLGWPYDKKLFQLAMMYDIPTASSVTVSLDIMTGLVGAQQELPAIQTFTLSPPSSTVGTPNRVAANFTIADGVVAKLVRLRPTVSSVPFKHFSYAFPEFTKYPADITNFTEWSNEGHPYQKELQTLELEINTGGIPCTVQVQGDGANLGPVFTITTTLDDRIRTFSFVSGLVAKNLRLVFTPGVGGRAQYFSHKFNNINYPPDVQQYAEWSDEGYTYQKELQTLEVEINTGGVACTIDVQGDGVSINLFTATTTLNDRMRMFSFAPGLTAKNLRLVLTPGTNGMAQLFGHKFGYIQYPPDSQQYAEWSDLGYPGDKTLRSLLLEMNTNNNNCSVQVQGDGANLGSPLTVNTTFNTRAQILAMPANMTAKIVRLLLTPSTGGVAQYFKHTFDFVKEPLAVSFWDSMEFNCGYDGYSFIKQMWLQYQCASSVTLTIYVDNGTGFYQVNLPAHPQRDVERFYLPAEAEGVYNKSKRKRITITSDNPAMPFKLYADGSRIEWMPCGADQRSAYQQFVFSSVMAPSIGGGA